MRRGPDRAAMQLLHENGGALGMDFKHDPELLNRVKNLGFSGMKEYLEYCGYDSKKADEEFKKKALEVQSHELPSRIEGINKLGGGTDTSGSGNDVYGGFGDLPK